MSLDAMKQALEALEELADEVFAPYDNKLGDAILALRAAIEQPRQWQGLTDEEIRQVCWESGVDGATGDREDAVRAAIAKLKEKNSG